MKILIVDDDKECCTILCEFVKNLDHEVESAFDGLAALKFLRKKSYDLIILDVNMPFLNGIELIRIIRGLKIEIEIILISGKSEIIESINAIDLGAADFLTKPVSAGKIAEVIKKIKIQTKEKKNKNFFSNIIQLKDAKMIFFKDIRFSENTFTDLKEVGQISISSDKMKNIYKKIRKLQDYANIPILIQGDTGTGKEVIAKYIHYKGCNKEKPFIAINCSTINKDIFESELFGYEKGAFTGASPKGKDGLIKAAEGGTFFFDEITEIPLNLQTKLLRLLQEFEYYKVGGLESQKVNTRFIFASNRQIEKMVGMGEFREDLYYRINICTLQIPALVQCREEILPLTILFIKNISKSMKHEIKAIEYDALKLLQEHSWPGNIRELKNTISKAILFCEDNVLTKEHFIELINKRIHPSRNQKENQNHSQHLYNLPVASFYDPQMLILPETPFSIDELNKIIIQKTLEKFKGNKSKTADFLGLTRIQLYRRFKDCIN